MAFLAQLFISIRSCRPAVQKTMRYMVPRSTTRVSCHRGRSAAPIVLSSSVVGQGNTPSIIDREDLRKLYPNLDNMDPRDRVVGDTGGIPPDQLPIIHIKCTHNNTIFTVTDFAGKTLAWTSAGAEGFKNARRGTTFAAQAAATAAAHKAIKLGLKRVKLKFKGVGPGRQSSIRGLEMGGISVHTIQDVTPVPHNGCRPRKARRI